MRKRLGLLGLAFIWAASAAEEAYSPRVNYMLQCQGCHLADGRGMAGRVPNMMGSVGRYLHSPQGRAFIVQVPGVAFSPLSDAQVSELMNWMLTEFSADELPANFKPYTEEEIAALRSRPEPDPMNRRVEILTQLSKAEGVDSL